MANLIGTVGVALLLGAFVLNLLKRMSADGYAYTALNLEGVWAIAAAFALGRKVVSPA
jgi:hypothetical protein